MNFGLKVIIGCAIALVIAFLLLFGFYAGGVAENIKSVLYWLGNAVLIYLLVRFSVGAYQEGDGVENKDRISICFLTAVVIVWLFAWAAAPRERAQVQEDANAAKTISK